MDLKIAFIGGGNMARAIVGGLLNAGYAGAHIAVADPLPAAQQAMQSFPDVRVFEKNACAAKDADVVVLAVKPQQVCAAVRSLAMTQRQLLISIVAGITTDFLQGWLGSELAIIRAMPNTPALIGKGATALYATSRVTRTAHEQAQRVLAPTGIIVWVEDEKLLDVVTALSGSGPAYFFRFIEALQSASSELGLDAELAAKLALQTALGAVELARASDVDLATLRQQVTSPGGTTEAALREFENHDLPGLMRAAVNAAASRSAELAREFGDRDDTDLN